MARRRRSSDGSKIFEVLMKLLAKGIAAVATSIFVSASVAKQKRRSSKEQPRESGRPSGDCDQEIVGESNYQRALRSIAGKGEVRHECQASVAPEAGNPHDDQAVMVTIDGKKVGYLARAVARRYRKAKGLASTQCQAVIVGGGDGRSLGVWLDLHI